jgi:hypothetical protein
MQPETLNQLDLGVLKLLITISSIILSLLIALVVYLIRKDIDKNEKAKELTNKSVNDLKLFLDNLMNKLSVMESRNQSFIEGCNSHHSIVDKRFDSHSKRLDTHGEKIAAHETKIQILERIRQNEK